MSLTDGSLLGPYEVLSPLGAGWVAEAMFGEKCAALDLLKRAVAAGYLNFDYMRRDPDLESLRGEPEYEALVEWKSRE